jgi:aryl-alcohol dehydrogenase-like predicted oxidoreductase
MGIPGAILASPSLGAAWGSEAGRTVGEAFDLCVNYFDVASSYFDGEAEMKLGPALEPYRKKSFLACKTMKRDAVGARQELEQSLGRLKTDQLDLYQFRIEARAARNERNTYERGFESSQDSFCRRPLTTQVRHCDVHL